MQNDTTARFPVPSHDMHTHFSESGSFSPQRINGLSPWQLRGAYSYYARFSGSGIKIAIVAALDNVAINENLSEFCRQFNLPQTVLSLHYYGIRAQSTTREWLIESSLDTQWAHAFAPSAEISVVFCENATTEKLLSAAEYAWQSLGADIVSMSFGSEESPSDKELGSFMENADCIFSASSGDEGGVTSFPSTSPCCLSIGGTKITFGADSSRVISRSAWRNSGGGQSDIFEMPSWQKEFNLRGNMRITPDLSMLANNENGASVYVGELGGWTQVGGTSLSAACFAGVCACIKQAHPEITKTSHMAEFLYDKAGKTGYAIPQYSFYDVTLGMSGNNRAAVGYDEATGLGEPVIRQLVL